MKDTEVKVTRQNYDMEVRLYCSHFLGSYGLTRANRTGNAINMHEPAVRDMAS
jgi:hypothetical protein